jgi:competence protein ComEA
MDAAIKKANYPAGVVQPVSKGTPMKYSRILALAFALAWPASLPSGTAVAQMPATATAPGKTAPVAAAKTAKAPLLDINTASEAELDAIPQIGPKRAKAIIAGRPYSGKDDLVSRKIISQSVYEKIRDKIIAKQ